MLPGVDFCLNHPFHVTLRASKSALSFHYNINPYTINPQNLKWPIITVTSGEFYVSVHTRIFFVMYLTEG